MPTRDAGFKARSHIAVATVIVGIRFYLKWKPYVRSLFELFSVKIRSENSNHHIVFVPEGNCLTKNFGSLPKRRAPKSVTEHSNLCPVRSILICGERAAPEYRRSEKTEEIECDTGYWESAQGRPDRSGSRDPADKRTCPEKYLPVVSTN